VKLDTHFHGRMYHHRLGEIGPAIGLTYEKINPIVRRLFMQQTDSEIKLLALDVRRLYAFVMNNAERLRHDFKDATTAIESSGSPATVKIVTKSFRIPHEMIFNFDPKAKNQEVMKKNVYKKYLASGEPRSASEKKFEDYCETHDSVLWLYKNGDKGWQFLSIIYEDAFGKQRAFYPDYIVGCKSGIYIIETKGGFDRTGKSQDIDIFSQLKFGVLKRYLMAHNLHGGFVREDKKSQKLCICTEGYSDDIESENWHLLSEVLP
jgi:type III restriction enzyme